MPCLLRDVFGHHDGENDTMYMSLEVPSHQIPGRLLITFLYHEECHIVLELTVGSRDGGKSSLELAERMLRNVLPEDVKLVVHPMWGKSQIRSALHSLVECGLRTALPQ